MLQRAESLGRELTDVSDEVRKQLKIEEEPAESKQAGRNGASADGGASPPVATTTDGIANDAVPAQEGD
jgi:hypothetical protein